MGKLTPRELEVLGLLCKGKLNKEVADHLKISLRTAMHHRENIYGKLGCHNTSSMLCAAVKRKLITLDQIE